MQGGSQADKWMKLENVYNNINENCPKQRRIEAC